MKPPKSVFVCQECGAQAQKWMGRCADCGAWNSLVEERDAGSGAGRRRRGRRALRARARERAPGSTPTSSCADAPRLATGIDEFDRVLGGGIVPGSLVLLGGEPGHRQVARCCCRSRASLRRARSGRCSTSRARSPSTRSSLRGERLGIAGARRSTCWPRPASSGSSRRSRASSPRCSWSIRSRRCSRSGCSPRRAASARCARWRRSCCSGQGPRTSRPSSSATSPRTAAWPGPKSLEHIVDTVLYFEGEQHHAHRDRARGEEPLRRGVRAGRVRDDRGAACGRCPIRRRCSWPSAPAGSPGSAVVCCDRGLAADAGRGAGAGERQPLRHAAAHGHRHRRRTACRCSLAVLEKRAGLDLVGDDVFVNVAGGMEVDEPAADLASWRPRSPRASATARCRRRPPCSARWAWPARCAAVTPGGATGAVRLHRWGSLAASCRQRNVDPTDVRRACELVGVATRRGSARAPLRVRAGRSPPHGPAGVRSITLRRDGESSQWRGSYLPGPDHRSRSSSRSAIGVARFVGFASRRGPAAARQRGFGPGAGAAHRRRPRDPPARIDGSHDVLGALIGGVTRPASAHDSSERRSLDELRDPRRALPARDHRWCLPYIGIVIGARKGEWLEPARLIGAVPRVRARSAATRCSTPASSSTAASPTSARRASSTARWSFRSSCCKELQHVADSADSLKRNRGRRGLDILQKIQKMAGVEVQISRRRLPGGSRGRPEADRAGAHRCRARSSPTTSTSTRSPSCAAWRC